MSDLNYSNYIYLFIDPHDITIGKDPAPSITEALGSDFHVPLDFIEGMTQQFNASYFLEDNADQLNFQTIQDLVGTIGDIPDFNTEGGVEAIAPERIQSPGVNSNQENMNVKKFGGQEYFKKTNDFASDPFSKHRFSISKGKVKFQPLNETDKYYYVSPVSYEYETPDGIIQDLQIAKNESRKLTQNPDILLQFKKPTYSENNKTIKDFGVNINTDFDLKPVSGFKFNQQSYLLVKDESNLPYSALEPRVTAFFMNLYSDIQNEPFGGYIMDCSTRIGVPYDYRTLIDQKADEKSAGVIKTGQPSYEAIYNYYDPQYEPAIIETLEGNSVTEKSLPNIYDLLYLPVQNQALKAFVALPEENQISIDNITFSNLNSYLDLFARNFKKYGPDGNLSVASTPAIINEFAPPSSVENNLVNNPGNSFLFTNKSIALNLLNKQVFSFAEGEVTLPLSDELIETKNTRIPNWQEDLRSGHYFSEKTMDYFNQAKNYEDAFPFYFKINLPVEQRGPLAKLLSQHDLLDSFNSHAASLVLPNFEIDSGISTVGDFYGGLINGYSTDYFNLYNKIKLKTFNLHLLNKPAVATTDSPDGAAGADQPPDYYTSDIFLDTIKDISLQSPKNVFVYAEENLLQTTSGVANLLQILKKQKFFKDLTGLLEDNKFFRTPKDIHDGKLAHQETLMYEVAKYKINENGSQQFVQSIFLPIVEQSNLTYYDTQVEPYKEYFYKIFAHKAVIGTKYRPTALPFVNPDASKILFIYDGFLGFGDKPIFTFNYEVEPYIKFIRVPYYNTPAVNILTDDLNYSMIEDLPPLPPQVNIVPFKNINDKILILLNNSSGQIKAKHQSIFESDDAKFIKCYVAQGLDYKRKDALLTFGGDDQQGAYEIFRVENMPSSYKDLQNDSTLQRQRANTNSPSIVDDILPNRNYYYTFRYVDVHNKLSNPTDFYKVMMVQQAGMAPYLKIELINIAEEKFKQQRQSINYGKKLKKYLKLKVAGEKSNIVAIPEIQYDSDGLANGDYKTQHIQMSDPPNNSPDSVFGRKFKMRITSKQTGRKIDINFRVKQPENIINET